MTPMFANKTAVVTGGAQGIGLAICQALRTQGATVRVIDKLPNEDFVGDIAQEEVLRAFAADVLQRQGGVDFLINNACLSRGGLSGCSYEDFNYVLRVGVSAPYLLAQLFVPHFCPGASIINISSTRQFMSQPDTESYSAAKGGIGALTHALAATLAGRVRVNAIAPGWIDTTGACFPPAQPDAAQPDAAQHPAGRVGKPEDIAALVVYLCSDAAGFLTGETITVDGGMTHSMVYHGDGGWSYVPPQPQSCVALK